MHSSNSINLNHSELLLTIKLHTFKSFKISLKSVVTERDFRNTVIGSENADVAIKDDLKMQVSALVNS